MNSKLHETCAITLSEMKPGDRGRLLSFGPNSKAYRGKLLAMGFTPGVEFKVTRLAPLGDPVILEIRGSCLSVRKGEASVLQVERMNG